MGEGSVDGQFAGFKADSYGAGFADVYDEWYDDVSDVPSTIRTLIRLADGGSILELGVGTGRIAIPLSRAGQDVGTTVTGIDASAAMLERLAANDTGRLVTSIKGDMLADLPDGPFKVVFIAYNTIFNLTAVGAQHRLFEAVAARLETDGMFIIEADVPTAPPPTGTDITVRSMTADKVVLSVSRFDAATQRADGQFVEITEGNGVRLRPWSIRAASPSELDSLAIAAAMTLTDRWADFACTPFSDDSDRHVSVYQHI